MVSSVKRLQAELADREAIRDCLARYCRGIDRMDEAMVLGVYWPDAVDEHLVFTGSPTEFVAWCMPLMRGMEQTVHLLGNILIAIDGVVASVETYFQAFHRLRADEHHPARDLILGGRYVDRFERRGDEWRIVKRTTIADWYREFADSGDWSTGPLGMKIVPGTRAPEDPSCRFPGLGAES